MVSSSSSQAGRSLYLQQVKDIGRVQPVVTEAVQKLHLRASRQLLEGALAEGVGLALLQLPAVVDDVIEVTAERLGARSGRAGGERFGLISMGYLIKRHQATEQLLSYLKIWNQRLLTTLRLLF